MSGLRVVAALALALVLALALPQRAAGATGITISTDIPSPQVYTVGQTSLWSYTYLDTNAGQTGSAYFLLGGASVGACATTAVIGTSTTVMCNTYTFAVSDDGRKIQGQVQDSTPSMVQSTGQVVHVLSIGVAGNANGLYTTVPAPNACPAGGSPCTPGAFYTIYTSSATVTAITYGTGFDTAVYAISGTGGISGMTTQMSATPGTTTTGLGTITSSDSGKILTVTISNSASPTVTETKVAGSGIPAQVTLIYLSVTSFTSSPAYMQCSSSPCTMGTYYIVVAGTTAGAAQTVMLTFTGTGFDTASTPVTGSGASHGAHSMTGTASSGITVSITTVSPNDNGQTITPSLYFSANSGTTINTTPMTVTLIYLQETAFTSMPNMFMKCNAAPCTVNTYYLVVSGNAAGTGVMVTLTFTGTGFDTAKVPITGSGPLGGTAPLTTGTAASGIAVSFSVAKADTLSTAAPLLYFSANSGTTITSTPASLTLVYLSLPMPATPTAVADSTTMPGTVLVATYAIGLAGGKASTASFTITGSGFDSAMLLDQSSNMQVGGMTPPGASSCTVTGGGGNAASATCTPHTGGVTVADDGSEWYIQVWHSSNPAVTMRSDPVRIVAFGIMTQPMNQIILATGMNHGSATFSVTPTPMTLSNAYSYTPTYSYNWQQKPFGGSFSNTVPAQMTSSIVVTSDGITPGVTATNGQVAANHQDIFQVQITVNGVTLTSSTASIQVMIGSYPQSSGKLNTTTYSSTTSNLLTYDYYAAGGTPWLSTPTSEPQYQQQIQVTNVFTLDNSGNIQANMVPGASCNLVLRDGSGTVLLPSVTSLSSTPPGGSGTLTVTYTIAAGPSDPPLPAAGGVMYTTYDYVTQLNGGYLEIDCNAGLVYGRPQNPPALNIRYPPKVSPELPGLPPFAPNNRYTSSGNTIFRWAASPSNFGNTGYSNFPEPGHWNYDSQQTVQLQFVHDGNPSVLNTAGIFVYNVQTGQSTGTTTVGPIAATLTTSAGGVLNVPWTIDIDAGSGNNLLNAINTARTQYFNHYLSITAMLQTVLNSTVGPQFSPFTMLWQPLCEAGTCGTAGSPTTFPTGYPAVIVDSGILLPHFPPVMNDYKLEPLTTQQNNYPDQGTFAWFPPSLKYVQYDGFPKHDSPFGNPQYSSVANPTYPKRNYDQIIEARVTGTFTAAPAAPALQGSYATTYTYFTSVAANLPGGVMSSSNPVASTNASIPSGVFVATSTISASPPQALYLYNKWEYRWVLGVYKVDGTYEQYVPGSYVVGQPPLTPNVNGTKANYPYVYHTVGGGWLGVWNWYPREFTPALCPTVSGPFAIGAANQVVAGPTSASMFPSPSSGVLSWAYSHNTNGGSFRLDANLTSSTLSGTGSAQLLPTTSGSNHVFTSTSTVYTQTVSPPAFAAPYPNPEVVGYTVVAQGNISSILSSDANSVIAAQYTHLLPNLGTATQGQKTVTAFPTVVTVNNCNGALTLTTTPMTVTHRPGETFVVFVQGGNGMVNVLVQDPASAAGPTTVVSVSNAGGVARFTTGYTSAGVALTSSKMSVSAGMATLYVYEQSNLPANWPFVNPGAVLAPQPAAVNVAIASQCLAPVNMTTAAQQPGVQYINAAGTSSQWIGCSTASPFTPPCCNTSC